MLSFIPQLINKPFVLLNKQRSIYPLTVEYIARCFHLGLNLICFPSNLRNRPLWVWRVPTSQWLIYSFHNFKKTCTVLLRNILFLCPPTRSMKRTELRFNAEVVVGSCEQWKRNYVAVMDPSWWSLTFICLLTTW